MLYTLNFEGKLFKDHLSILTQKHLSHKKTSTRGSTDSSGVNFTKFSSQGLVVFSKLSALKGNRKLCKDGCITVTTTNISDYICKGQVLTGRMVRHQLNLLTKEASLLITNTQYKNTCQITISDTENKQYLPIFGIKKVSENTSNEAEKSEFITDCTVMLVLSLILDKAAFNYRAGDDFKVSASQLKHLATDLNITEKTLINTLTKMIELEMISVNTSELDKKVTGKALLSHSISVSENLFNEYSKLITLSVSKKCQKFNKKKIHAIKDGVAYRNSKPAEINTQDEVKTIYSDPAPSQYYEEEIATNTQSENIIQNTSVTTTTSDIKSISTYPTLTKEELQRLTDLKKLEAELNSHHVDNFNSSEKYGRHVENFWSYKQKSFTPCEKNLVTYIS